ncbi:pimeloyl-ACP methyl ester carboxylesterase [Chryseobacterium sp. 52]|uniref:alpha/beta fold hydrolase n=1 Tax=Chryseobacterium sp. 52 TaxID=2035213 RepID=UPI000C1907F5|nr:alpha/beta hydrolase [Chryseobacterium sp. 52]PIF45505.1 pimeloyl-ACP methyl ester carboxylesterase [Chryseobacterium sp. 52]
MRYYLKLFIVFAFSILGLISCEKDSEQLDTATNPAMANPSEDAQANTFVDKKITVEHDEEKMPVWFYGKSNSNTVILMVHGGPGSDIMDYRNYKGGTAFRKLENNYIVAYWQQRAAGSSQGPNNPAYYTIPQFAEDCDEVISAIKTNFPGKKIVLMGHSWGGMLTSYYLRDAARRAKIAAWVDIAGVHNGTILFNSSATDLTAEANQRISLGQNVAYWTSVKNQVAANPQSINSLSYSCIENISEVPVKVPVTDFSFTPRALTSNQYIFPVLINTDNNTYLPSYTLPTLLLWGKYDFSVSKQLRNQVLQLSGANNIVSVEFNSSSHFTMFQEPDLFAGSIKTFIEGL